MPAIGVRAEPPRPTARRGRAVAALEVLLAAYVVVADLLVPSLVLVLLAGVSLAVRRDGLATLGVRRPAQPARLVATMAAVGVGWTLVHVALLDPIAEHLTGRRQVIDQFADLQGDLPRLLLLLALSWTLAAGAEELAFRGYLLTRAQEALAGRAWGGTAAVVVSAALFGLIHTEQGSVGVLLAAIDGVLFALLRLRTGTLWAPILVHGVMNTVGFTAFYLAGPVGTLW